MLGARISLMHDVVTEFGMDESNSAWWRRSERGHCFTAPVATAVHIDTDEQQQHTLRRIDLKCM
jgi:hypothetical protein